MFAEDDKSGQGINSKVLTQFARNISAPAPGGLA